MPKGVAYLNQILQTLDAYAGMKAPAAEMGPEAAEPGKGSGEEPRPEDPGPAEGGGL